MQWKYVFVMKTIADRSADIFMSFLSSSIKVKHDAASALVW